MKKTKCLICSADTNEVICFYNLFKNKLMCCACYGEIKFKNKVIKYKDHKIKILFEYNEVFQKLIYLWKIYRLPEANTLLFELVKKFLPNTKIITPPSWKKDSAFAQFLKEKHANIFKKNHFYELKSLPIEKRFAKFSLIDSVPKKFILLDDIYTSGKTIKKAIDLIESKVNKKFKIIVLCSTK